MNTELFEVVKKMMEYINKKENIEGNAEEQKILINGKDKISFIISVGSEYILRVGYNTSSSYTNFPFTIKKFTDNELDKIKENVGRLNSALQSCRIVR